MKFNDVGRGKGERSENGRWIPPQNTQTDAPPGIETAVESGK